MKLAPWSELWDETNRERLAIEPSKLCTFGIAPLDDAAIGILKKDFIVLGADSGQGKSEVVLKIALHNALQGRRVALYFIEGGGQEALYRIKYGMISKLYFNKYSNLGLDLDYRRWRMNMIDKRIVDIEMECFREFQAKIGDNLKIFTFNHTFTIKDFVDSFGYFLKPESPELKDDPLSYSHQVDLIIIDHLQYFSLLNPKNEIAETSDILKKINEITHHYQIPVILVSHLRKKEKDRGLPNQEDFFGTSNIAKMASMAITLSAGEQRDNEPYVYPTYFRFVKTRTKISPNLAMLCDFDLTQGQYKHFYEVYKLFRDQPQGRCLLNHQLPDWARGARR